MIGSYLIDDYANGEFISHLVPQIAGAAAMPVLLLIFLAFKIGNWRWSRRSSSCGDPLVFSRVFITIWKKVIEGAESMHRLGCLNMCRRLLSKPSTSLAQKFERLKKH